jgi:hypothetical protein
MNGAIKNGLIIGLIGIIFTTIMYTMGAASFSSPMSLAIWPITIGFRLFKRLRKVPRIFVLLKSQKTSGIWHD